MDKASRLAVDNLSQDEVFTNRFYPSQKSF